MEEWAKTYSQVYLMIFRTIWWSIEAVSWVETAWNKMARGDNLVTVISKWMFYIAKLILKKSLISNPIIKKVP